MSENHGFWPRGLSAGADLVAIALILQGCAPGPQSTTGHAANARDTPEATTEPPSPAFSKRFVEGGLLARFRRDASSATVE